MTTLAMGVLGILLLTLLAAFLLTFKEQAAYRNLVEAAENEDSFAEQLLTFPEPTQAILQNLQDELKKNRSLDDALVDALVETSATPFGPRPALRTIMAAVLALLVALPLAQSAIAGAVDLHTVVVKLSANSRGQLLLNASEALEGPFSALRDGFAQTAWLSAVLCAVWAFFWLLRRPEAAEARFVRALLEAATQLKPASPAPIAGRMAETIAPDRGLTRPLVASGAWLIATTAGWLVLYQTADVRASNYRPQSYQVWPEAKKQAIDISRAISLPVIHAGRPVEGNYPTLSFTLREVSFQQTSLAPLQEGILNSDWQAQAPSLDDKLAAKAPGKLMLLAHQDIDLDTIYQVLSYLRRRYQINAFQILTERNMGPSKGKAQATLELSLEGDGGVSLVATREDIRLAGQEPQPWHSGQWAQVLKKQARSQKAVLSGTKGVLIETGLGVKLRQLAQVMAAADTACQSGQDCGLPGIGLRFIWRHVP